ncbi:DNA-processing protein DprA [Desulforamulus ferrireducens]|uniref:DNA protecting protein DprA n=1 Tax=Desulforamulus ferrireducens TaxID=1833852 RepID=A0A1S6J0M5_9FIRM|nr:DNA-processing protein DprA [Desulforamulus ferrireducens]AQS60569.1 DNA protecting protein DprA [Desulforamulus ferrireducens]
MPGSGRRLWELFDYFGSPREAWEASEAELAQVYFIGPQRAKKLVRGRDTLEYDKLEQYLKNIDCQVITLEDENYPAQLKNIYDPPLALFVRGALPSQDKIHLALVGSRQASPYGLAVAESFASELAASGVVIVSGMARGIDSAAHRGALLAGGTTIAVLGCGPDVVYPKENHKLMKQIMEQGAVITEFPPGTAPTAWHFPSRNRIISGLSQGVLVIEAAEKSGALITADFALEQGREVMAIPGNINNLKSAGTNKLIRQGAILVTSPAEVWEELGLGDISLKQREQKESQIALTDSEMKVLATLSHLPSTQEQIIHECQLPAGEVAVALTMLEIKGLIRVLPGKMYVTAGL